MLGDMGADVIKVEPPGAGDDTRTWGPPFVNGESAYFLGVNRNKRSLTLNMAVKAGQEILARLVKKSRRAGGELQARHAREVGHHQRVAGEERPAGHPLLDHRLRLERARRGAAGLRLHPAGRVGADEHLRRAGRHAHEIRRRDRGRGDGPLRLQRHPRRARRAGAHRPRPARRGVPLRFRHRDADQRRLQLPAFGQGRAPLSATGTPASSPTPPTRPPTA